MPQSLTLGSIELSDGRIAAYADTRRHGQPVIVYCHGTPGCRLELDLALPALERCGTDARFIALDRPGYGPSSFVRRPGFLAWPRDLEEVLDRLAIERISVLGASGGAPFALSAAASMGDRIDRMGLVAGVAPPDTPGMEESATIAGEFRSEWLRTIRYGALSLATRLGLADRIAKRVVAALGPADRRAMSDPPILARFERILEEAFAQWGRASVHEAGLFLRPWDLDLSTINAPLRIWHGLDDNRIPGRVAEAMAERIPGTEAVLWPQHGHFSWALDDTIAEVVDFLTGMSN